MQDCREIACPHCGAPTVFFLDPAEGTHQELMRSSPIYREIYDSQLGDGFRLDNSKQAAGRVEAEP